MEANQPQPDKDTTLFPVHILYRVYDDIVFGTLRVGNTQADDLVCCSIRNESPARRAAQLADIDALLATDHEATTDPNRLLLQAYSLMTKYRASTYWAIYHAEAHSHERTIGMADHFRLHLALIRARQTLAQAEIIASAGVLRIASCQGVEITLEPRSLDPVVAMILDLVTDENPPTDEQERG
jgi:hypothetical protein